MNGLHKQLYQWAINHRSFGPCTFSMWLLMCPIWLNDFGHISQWYGFSPPWSLAWTLRLDFVVNFLPHCWQGKAHRWSSSVCTLMWDLRSEALLKDMVWHRAQLNGFSPVWICVWFLRFLSDRKVFWQVLQTIVAVLWICTMLCFLRECLRLNVCLHMLQGNGRASLCCSSLWTFKWPGLPKFFSHRGHWWFLSPSWNTEKCLFM